MAIVRAQEATSSTFRYNYQVFLSFRGEDTRKNFTDHLYAALVQAGLRTFRDDDEIERGKRLELELRRAIQQSRISIIVLSKNYATSKWCLDEVVMILEWSKIGGNEVLPVFYDVDPSDVRKQTGSIGQAFARYEMEFNKAEIDHEIKKEWMEKVKRWKVALEEVANLTGMVLQNQADGHEAKFIREIVKVVERKLNRAVLYAGRHLVGMHFRAKDIDLWVQDSSSSEDILVICGMGGIGKTTIAKYVFNLNFQRFEGSSFLASVKDKSQQPNGLVNLQRQLLSNILKGKRKQIYNVDEGIIKINEAICCKRVLVVIDDVDEVKQLDALLGTTREFHPGSKIIVTTRNLSLIKPHEVHKLHTVEKLGFYESLELFCWHAFGKEHPIEGYTKQLERAVYHCEGLPLAHEILGSSLAGKSTEVWASKLEKLEAIPETKILDVLKISFDSLEDDHDKNLFLHIACFFVGHKKDEMIEILDACDFFTVCGIQNLVDRCLLSIDEDSKLMMHQFIQEMGRQIVDQESPKEPGRRSRLWRHRDSFKVLKGKMGTETIEGLMLDMRMYKDNTFNVKNAKNVLNEEFCDTLWSSNQGSSFKQHYFRFLSSETLDAASDVELKFDAFSRMDNLRLLKLNYVKLSGCCQNFPEDIRWLCWHGFPLKSIPFDLPLGNLVSLDMRYSKLEHVWAGNKVLLSLKILNLSHSEWLVKTPNFTGLPNLERLILKGCVRLVEVCDTIGNLERLSLLNLENCKSLRKFPMDLENMESLKVLNANGITVNRLPSIRGDVKLWHTWFWPWVSKPMKNPEFIYVSLPRSLVSLSLQNCDLSDDDFPLDFSNLSLLERLDLSSNHFRNLPGCIGSLSKLKKLNLRSCKQLRSISGLPNVNILGVEECTSLESVTYQSALNKPFIKLHGCGKLREIQGIVKFEPVEKVNKEILYNLGLSGVELMTDLNSRFTWEGTPTPFSLSHDRVQIKEICRQVIFQYDIDNFLQRREIPSWSGDRNNKNCLSLSISFVVPSFPKVRLRGLGVYFEYTISNTERILQGPSPFLLTKISNKTKDLDWIYNPVFFTIPEECGEELVWFSRWKFGNHQLESGDVVNVSVIAANGFELIECALDDFVWDEEEEEIKEAAATTTHHHNNTGELVGIYNPFGLKGVYLKSKSLMNLNHTIIAASYYIQCSKNPRLGLLRPALALGSGLLLSLGWRDDDATGVVEFLTPFYFETYFFHV